MKRRCTYWSTIGVHIPVQRGTGETSEGQSEKRDGSDGVGVGDRKEKIRRGVYGSLMRWCGR